MICVASKCIERTIVIAKRQTMNIAAVAIEEIFHKHIGITGSDSISGCSCGYTLRSSILALTCRCVVMRLCHKESNRARYNEHDEYDCRYVRNQFQASLQ